MMASHKETWTLERSPAGQSRWRKQLCEHFNRKRRPSLELHSSAKMTWCRLFSGHSLGIGQRPSASLMSTPLRETVSLSEPDMTRCVPKARRAKVLGDWNHSSLIAFLYWAKVKAGNSPFWEDELDEHFMAGNMASAIQLQKTSNNKIERT